MSETTSQSGLRYTTLVVTVGDYDGQETIREITDQVAAGVRSRGFMTVDVQQADQGITLTAAQLREWAGLDRDLTADELEQIDECIPNSSIPDAIGTIATDALGLS